MFSLQIYFAIQVVMKTFFPNIQPVVSANTTSPAGPATPTAPQKKPSMIEQFMPFVFILLILYFLFIRPAQKKAKKHAEFTSNLKRGQSVLTSGGLLGKIDGLTEQYVILELAESVKVRVLRSHISSVPELQKKPAQSNPQPAKR